MARTITSANAVLILSVAGLFDVPTQIQGFTADDVTDVDAVDMAETVMGVDGLMSVGYVPAIVVQNIAIQADSLSVDFFEKWYQSNQTQREAYIATGSLILRSVGKKYALTRGVLRSGMPLPPVKRTVQSRRWTLNWQAVTSAPL